MPDVAAGSGCGLAWAPSAATPPTPPSPPTPTSTRMQKQSGVGEELLSTRCTQVQVGQRWGCSAGAGPGWGRLRSGQGKRVAPLGRE